MCSIISGAKERAEDVASGDVDKERFIVKDGARQELKNQHQEDTRGGVEMMMTTNGRDDDDKQPIQQDDEGGRLDSCQHVSSIDYGITSKKLEDPSTWSCDECTSNTESVWICLQCAHTGCGRSCRQQHAQKHYERYRHPVVMHINLKMPFCYECNDWIINDHHLGYLEMLRESISRLQEQTFPKSTTRSGKVIRGAITQFQGSNANDDRRQERQSREFSGEFTALRHYELALQRRCVLAWQRFKDLPGGTMSATTTAPSSPIAHHHHPLPQQRQFLGQTGLRNIGNTCYQNATLMCLSTVARMKAALKRSCPSSSSTNHWLKRMRRSSEELYSEVMRSATAIINTQRKRRPTRSNQRSDHADDNGRDRQRRRTDSASLSLLPLQLQSLFRIIWSGKWAGICPSFFVRTFMIAVPRFQGHLQHDAQEFLTTLVAALIEGCNPLQELMTSTFSSQCQSETCCSRCGQVSVYSWPYITCITLDLDTTCLRLHQASSGVSAVGVSGRYTARRRAGSNTTLRCTLTDCLDDLVAPVQLTGDNRYRCDSSSCAGRLASATKRDVFARLAPCVVLHLNRTKWDSKGKRKILHRIEFPLKDLNLSKITVDVDDDRTYSLRGIVLHHGADIDEGHYTSICYQDDIGSFVAFNDLRSSLVSEDSIRTERYQGDPYLLFYELT